MLKYADVCWRMLSLETAPLLRNRGIKKLKLTFPNKAGKLHNKVSKAGTKNWLTRTEARLKFLVS
jgi:hypothetical protein